MSSLIDIHTHQFYTTENLFQLKNIIISKDYMIAGPCSVGIHPWYVDMDYDAQLQLLTDYASRKNILAIGECGLDKLCETNWQKQVDIFEKQIHLASQYQKPLIIHCVRAYQEVLQHVQKHNTPVIFHGFNKNIELAKQIIDKDHFLSLGAALCKGNMDSLIKMIPLNRIFFETDDKSIDIVDIYNYFCTVRKISLQELKQQIQNNFEHVFKYTI